MNMGEAAPGSIMSIPGMPGSNNAMNQMAVPFVDPNTKTSRELYIGNMPGGGQEEALKVFLGQAMQQAGLCTMAGNPVIQTRCNEKFAFAEFRSVPECSNALNLNGISFQGRPLNVGRPRAYTGPPTPATTWPQLMALKMNENPELRAGAVIGVPASGIGAGAGASVPQHMDPATKTRRELYIGNVPEGVNELQLQQFLSQAMLQTKLNSSPEPIIQCRISGRFAFVEFRSIEDCNRAMNLNGIPLLNMPLRIGRPRAYEGPTTAHGTWQEACAIGIDGILAKYPNGGNTLQMGIGAPPMLAAMAGLNPMAALAGAGGMLPMAMQSSQPRLQPTRVLQLSGMVTVEDLKDNSEFADITDDVRMEMAKSGEVKSIAIPRPGNAQALPEAVGLIYVEFAAADSSVQAMTAIRGRTFNGRQVGVHFYPEDKYAQGVRVDITKHQQQPVRPMVPQNAPPPVMTRPPAPMMSGGGRMGGMMGVGGMAMAPGKRLPPALPLAIRSRLGCDVSFR